MKAAAPRSEPVPSAHQRVRTADVKDAQQYTHSRSFIPLSLLTLSALVLPIFLVHPFLISYPYTDDWILIRPIDSPLDYVTWLFTQHNDHFIPIQKLIQSALIKLSGYDFRILIILNYIVAVIVCSIWFFIFAVVRKFATLGDFIIPAVLLNQGFSTFRWGFAFQFLSTTFFLSGALLFSLLSIQKHESKFSIVAFFSLALCAWTGANGTIMSITFGIVALYVLLPRRHDHKIGFIIAVLAWLISVTSIIYQYRRSGAVVFPSGAELTQVAVYYLRISASWFGLAFLQFPVFKAMLTQVAIALVFVLTVGLILTSRKNEKTDEFYVTLALGGVVIASVILLALIALGRMKTVPYTPGLESHYGYNAAIIPIASWLMISLSMKGQQGRCVGSIALLTLALAIFALNLASANQMGRYMWAQSLEPQTELGQKSVSPKVLLDRHMKSFWYLEDDRMRPFLEEQIKILRAAPNSIWSNESAK
jgi:hypothetical protein